MPIQVGLDAVASVYSPFLQSHFYSRSCIALAIAMIAIFYSCYLPQAVNCGRFCFWHRQSAVLFVYETPRETVERLCAKFTRRRGQRPKPPRTKTAFSAACVRFMSGKTSLATSFFSFFFRSDFSSSLTRFSQKFVTTRFVLKLIKLCPVAVFLRAS